MVEKISTLRQIITTPIPINILPLNSAVTKQVLGALTDHSIGFIAL
jgi:hypothetical protein